MHTEIIYNLYSDESLFANFVATYQHADNRMSVLHKGRLKLDVNSVILL